MNIIKKIHNAIASVGYFTLGYKYSVYYSVYKRSFKDSKNAILGNYALFKEEFNKISWGEIDYNCLFTGIWFKSIDGKSCISDAQIQINGQDFFLGVYDWIRVQKFLKARILEKKEKDSPTSHFYLKYCR